MMRKHICARCSVLVLTIIFSLFFQGCSKSKEIPFSSDDAIGANYQKVVEELESAGFSDIELKKIDTADGEKNDKVEEISVNEESNFVAGQKFQEDVTIKIVHYALLQIEPELKIEFKGENDEPQIIVHTNLPAGTRLKVLVSCEQKGYLQEKTASVVSGKVTTNWGGWTDSWTPGKYSVTVEMRLKDQISGVLAQIGYNGDTLIGKNVCTDSQTGEKYLCERADYEVDEQNFLQKYPTGDKRTLYLVEKAVQEKYGMQYTITKEYTGLTTITIWNDKFSEKYAAAQSESSDALRDWYELRKEITNFAGELQKIAPLYWIRINVVEENEKKTPMLEVTEDVVEYDALRKEKPVRADKSNVNYVGLVGYLAVYDYPDVGEYSPIEDENFATAEWTVSTYKKDKQFYVKNGTAVHKTKVQVSNQEVKDKGNHYGEGYLTVVDLSNGNTYLVNMHNFVTLPYWELDVETAVSIGKCVGRYCQKSDYWPVPINSQERAVEGTDVLLIGENDHRIIGLIYQNGTWLKYEFQPEDLTIVK